MWHVQNIKQWLSTIVTEWSRKRSDSIEVHTGCGLEYPHAFISSEENQSMYAGQIDWVENSLRRRRQGFRLRLRLWCFMSRFRLLVRYSARFDQKKSRLSKWLKSSVLHDVAAFKPLGYPKTFVWSKAHDFRMSRCSMSHRKSMITIPLKRQRSTCGNAYDGVLWYRDR